MKVQELRPEHIEKTVRIPGVYMNGEALEGKLGLLVNLQPEVDSVVLAIWLPAGSCIQQPWPADTVCEVLP